MIYGLFRWFTGIALHWFYSNIEVVAKERIPVEGPVLLAASHHNALVDCLIAGWIIPRRLTITAKATLMDNAFLAWLLPAVGVVPLRRASDERAARSSGDISQTRNINAFRNLIDALEAGRMVLIFPEGKSHSEPALAPLKTGIARIALEARDIRGIPGLQINPLGLSFEDKANPGTAVLAEFGEPIRMDDIGSINVASLTQLIEDRLAAVSLKQPQISANRDLIKRKGVIRPLGSPLIAWGELTHRYIINKARDIALARSKNPDDPAMLTIIFGLVLILLSYAVQFAIVTALLNPWWAALYTASLPLGAYWAAYKSHHTL
ncbi:MAG: lysophospholipid acyltransferase family protein [Gemmatimonadaceae bacterium]